jgi:PIN like domain
VTPTAKPAEVRFYFDADVLGVAKVVASLRFDVTYPGDAGAVIHRRTRPPCIVESPAAPDTEWIPRVTAAGWLIVTRDSRIQDHRAEIEAVRAAGARMVALSGRDAIGTWDQLEVVMSQWRAIERLLDQPGPFIYRASRTNLRAVPLHR